MAKNNPDRQVLIEFHGENFRRMRLAMDLTQPQLAEILSFKHDTSIDVKTISSWENGKAKLPTWANKQRRERECFLFNRTVPVH